MSEEANPYHELLNSLNATPDAPAIKNKNDINIKKVYAYAHAVNREGRDWTPEDTKSMGVDYGISKTKIENIVADVFENNADEHGFDHWQPIEKARFFIGKNYDFRFNEVTQVVEYKKKTESDYRPLSADTVYNDLQTNYIRFSLANVKALFKDDYFVPKIDPIRQYFEQLPPWDGVDHIGNLSNYIQAKDQQFFNAMFKKMLIRCINCSVNNIVNRYVFVMVSEGQELGKSSFIRFLNPWGSREYYTESPLTNNKDCQLRFAQNFIYNLEELQDLNAKDVNNLKALISQESVKERAAYKENENRLPRRCNFFASTNKVEFLSDTLNTRWLCLWIDKIDWKGYSKNIDIHKVWSQAWHLLNNGTCYNLSEEEKAKQSLDNKEYEIESMEKNVIRRFFIPSDDKDGHFLTNSEIIEYMHDKTGNKIRFSPVVMGFALKQLGFKPDRKKINGQTLRGYYLKLTEPDITPPDTVPF